jgi:sugar/nucleoside kinase (ribokinase family)
LPERDYDILTIADMCVDLIMDLGEAVPQFGQVEQWVADYFMEMGGSACIFACQAAKLGLRTGIFGRVGPDTAGGLMLRRLNESGVDTRFVIEDPLLKTGLGVALCKPDGDRAILTYGGSLNAVYAADITDDFLKKGRHLHYCSYYLQTNLLPAVPEMLRRARDLGLTVSLDTNWDPAETWDGGLREAIAQADLFFPNENEALAIARQADLYAALQTLHGWGRPDLIVVVKRGEKGALVSTLGAQMEVPVVPVEQLVDTIGAGDSFDAGFLGGWLRGLPPADCAALANACGRATTQARGGIQGQPTVADFPLLS